MRRDLSLDQLADLYGRKIMIRKDVRAAKGASVIMVGTCGDTHPIARLVWIPAFAGMTVGAAICGGNGMAVGIEGCCESETLRDAGKFG